MNSSVTALIADDEPLARQRLRNQLATVPWIDLIGETEDGPSTVEETNLVEPDLLFLDAHMPGFSGLEVLERLDDPPHVVFTTAYDRYAVAAFELHALDYLLKPISRKRFDAAMERVREAVRDIETVNTDRGLARLFLRRAGKIIPLAVDAIARIEASDDYACIHTKDGEQFLASIRMLDLETQLDPSQFLRIHRSHIINLEVVASFDAHSSGRLQVTLVDGTRLFASRTRSRELRKIAI